MSASNNDYFFDLAWRPEFVNGCTDWLESIPNDDEGCFGELKGLGVRVLGGVGLAGASALDSLCHLAAAIGILGTFLWIPATITYYCAEDGSKAKRFGEYCNFAQGLKHLADAVGSLFSIPIEFCAGISGPPTKADAAEKVRQNEEARKEAEFNRVPIRFKEEEVRFDEACQKVEQKNQRIEEGKHVVASLYKGMREYVERISKGEGIYPDKHYEVAKQLIEHKDLLLEYFPEKPTNYKAFVRTLEVFEKEWDHFKENNSQFYLDLQSSLEETSGSLKSLLVDLKDKCEPLYLDDLPLELHLAILEKFPASEAKGLAICRAKGLVRLHIDQMRTLYRHDKVLFNRVLAKLIDRQELWVRDLPLKMEEMVEVLPYLTYVEIEPCKKKHFMFPFEYIPGPYLHKLISRCRDAKVLNIFTAPNMNAFPDFEHLEELHTLTITELFNMPNVSHASVAKIKKLRCFTLNAKRTSNLDGLLNALSYCENLTTISFCQGKLSAKALTLLNKEKMQKIYFRDIQINRDCFEILGEFHNLTELMVLGSAEISPSWVPLLNGCTALQNFILSSNPSRKLKAACNQLREHLGIQD